MIHLRMVERAQWHPGIRRIPRVLHDGHTTAPLDRDEPRRALVHHAGEYDANNTRAVRDGGRSKERIDPRSVPVFSRALRDQHLPLFDQQMTVWGSDVDVRRLQVLAIFGELGV